MIDEGPGSAGAPASPPSPVEAGLEALGLGGLPAEQVGEYVMVDGDLRLRLEDVLAAPDRPIEKGYECSGLANCWGETVTEANKVRLRLASDIPAIWRKAFIEAAYVVSTQSWGGKQSRISIDAVGARTSGPIIDVVTTTNAANGGALAQGEFPQWRDSGWTVPGPQIRLARDRPEFTAGDKDLILQVAIHELLHNFGFAHPGQGTLIPGTKAWANFDSMGVPNLGCTGQTYETIMSCVEAGRTSYNYATSDDAESNYRRYGKSTRYDTTAADWSFCTPTSPCGIGEGDCDTDADCEGYLVCVQDALSTTYSHTLVGLDICGPPATEAGSFGACPTSNGGGARCTDPGCPCGLGEGDCDSDRECGGSMVCSNSTDNGLAVGLSFGTDVCKHRRPPGCSAVPNGPTMDWGACSEACPCSLGEGDCDNDNQCVGRLVCANDVGADFKKEGADYQLFDVCVDPVLSNL